MLAVKAYFHYRHENMSPFGFLKRFSCRRVLFDDF